MTNTYPLRALALTFLVQALATVGLLVPAVLAPVVAPQLGLEPRGVGYLQGLVYLSAMLCGVLTGNLANKHSGVRVSQWALVLVALGLGTFSLAGWAVAHLHAPRLALFCLLSGAVLVGCGYGLPNPSAAKILGHHAPKDKRGLYFSVKQAGVPAGVAVCGFVLPAMLLWTDWTIALVLAALVMLGTCVWLQRQFRFIDTGPVQVSAAAAKRAPDFSPLFAVFAAKPVRQIAMLSFVFAANQACFLAFLVTFLVTKHHFSLINAAAILGFGQLASVLARPLWGYVADSTGNPLRVIGCLGVAMAIALWLLAWGQAWGLPTLLLSIAVGATAVAWNGVYYAQLTKVVPTEQLASMTAGSQFLTFAGAMSAPVVFGWIVGGSQSYSLAFSIMAATAFFSGCWTLSQSRHKSVLS